MILVLARLGRRIALALFGDDMDQDRLVELGVAGVLQNRQQMVEIVPSRVAQRRIARQLPQWCLHVE